MVESTDALLKQALHLSESDRAVLIRRLIASLDGVPQGGEDGACHESTAFDDGFFRDPAIKQAWDEEIQRRLDKMDRGEMKMVSWEQVREQARKIVDG